MTSVEEALLQMGILIVFSTATGALVYALTRTSKLCYEVWSFSDGRLAGIFGLAAFGIGWLLGYARSYWQVNHDPLEPMFGGVTIIWGQDLGFVRTQAESYLVMIVPILLMMLLRREPLKSAGVSRQNLGRSFLIGLLLGFVFIAAQIAFNSQMQDDTGGVPVPNSLWDLPGYAIIGFAEEFIFRGYLQTRLLAWLGLWQGWGVASVIMALWHVPARMVTGMPLLDAFMDSIIVIPVSLLFGYTMLRTGNIVASGLAHTCADLPV